jgi:hypothetical protein
MINPSVVSISFRWLIINFIYFYAPTVTRMYPSNSFMDGSAIDNILPIFSVCRMDLPRPLPRWVPGPITQWAPGTTRLVPHGT